MPASDERIIPHYRAPSRRALPEWMNRDRFAELCIGLGWTACGVAALLTAIAWVFLRMEPRQPIQGPWWAMIAFCLAFNTLGLALALSAVVLGFWRDTILRSVWILTLLLAIGGYAALAGLIITAPTPAAPAAPLQFQAPEEG